MIRKLLINLLVWTLAREAKRKGWDRVKANESARKQVVESIQNWREQVLYGQREDFITAARLNRRFDPGMTLNEVTNRAIAQKQAARVQENGPQLSYTQLAALKVQKEYLERVARNS